MFAVVAADSSLTFDEIVKYLDLEVKEERLVKMVNESSTVFTLGADQVKVLKSKGASDRLIDVILKKGQAPAQSLGPAASDISDYVLILDCSGSMKDQTVDGSTKFDVAKKAALDLIAAIPNGRQLAFIAYGHQKNLGCESVEVMRPLAPISDRSRQALSAMVNELQPIGNTPIARALRKAGRELENASGLAKLVLITDGMETCGGDPVADAKHLAANKRLKGGVNVIGFDLNPEEAAAVAKIAKAGNGEFYDAKKAADLVKTVQVVAATIEKAEPVAHVPGKAKAVPCDCKPSTDVSNPATLQLGCYAAGRLSSKKSHFFAIDLPAGDYVAVADIKYASGTQTNQVICHVDERQVFSHYESDPVLRAAGTFHVDAEPALVVDLLDLYAR